MADPFYSQYETNLGTEVQTRTRFESADTLAYELLESDFLRWPGFLYHSLAESLYDDVSLWWVIQDANPIRRASEWSVGEVIAIPKDYRDAIIRNEDQTALVRGLY